MNILYVSPTYVPRIGGVEYVVKSLASRLVRLGHQVTVLCGEPSIDKPREEEIEGVHVIRWPVVSLKNAYYIPRHRSGLVELLKELIRVHDIVHVHNAHAVFSVWTGIKIKQLNSNVKLVFTLHYHGEGHTWLRNLLWRLLWRGTVRKLIRLSDRIHAVSDYEAQLITKHYPEASGKITVISNGIDEDVLKYKWRGQNSDYIIYAGRVEKYKRLELAIDLAKQLGLKLLIIGDGSYKNKLARYSRKRYPGKVVFLQAQPRHKYLELLSDARYAVNPSRHEAYSIFAAEALSIGVPSFLSITILNTLGLTKYLINYGMYKAKTMEELMLVNPAEVQIRIVTWMDIVNSMKKEYVNVLNSV